MASISLHEYNQYIRSLIDQNNLEEAIFHCTTILKSYPKCITTYENLGEALLESKRFKDAEEVFSKILAVYPDNFIAHAGLSAVYEEDRDLDKAIWHMERAFESQPSNVAIQEEIRNLIGRRDGVPPSKIRLTRGALIRMYAKGELYQQAIAELQSTLEIESDRPDLEVLLARMYYLSGAYTEARETCTRLLSKYPYCYEANQIMYSLSPEENEEGNNPIFQQRLSELDPYFNFVEKGEADSGQVPYELIQLEKPEFVPTEKATASTPDWARQIGITWDESLEYHTIDHSELNAFLPSEANEQQPSAIPFIEEIDQPLESAFEENQLAEPVSEELPDWIAKAGWTRANEQESSSEIEPGTHSEEKLESPLEEAAPADELPDWLKSFGSPEDLKGSETLQPSEEKFEEFGFDTVPSLSPESIEEILSDNLIAEESQAPTETLDEKVPSESMDVDELSKSTEELHKDEEEIPDLPDWLKALEIEESIENLPDLFTPEEVISPPESTSDLDFLTELANSDLLGEMDLGMESPSTESGSEIESPQPENAEPEEIKGETREPEEKSAVPSWVQRILAGQGTISTPVVAESKPEEKPVESVESTAKNVEELITDLPEEQPEGGLLSKEMNEDLITWLHEISPEEEAAAAAPVPETTSETTTPDTGEITFEKLSSSESVEEFEISGESNEELVSELEETPALDDRLFDLLENENEKVVEAPVLQQNEIVHEPEQAVDISILIQLLQEKQYSVFNDKLNENRIPSDLIEEVIAEINQELVHNPTSYELWQSLGDLEMQKSNPSAAIEAYLEAERMLFH